MIKTYEMLLQELHNYAAPRSKISRMVDSGELFPITKGLYETKADTPAQLLAGSIYGPSYISFEYALHYHGIVQDTANTVTCATFDKKKKKRYENLFGVFTYRDVPSEAFPCEVKVIQDGNYSYRIATPEKALCDLLYTLGPVPNAEKLFYVLTNELHIKEETLTNLDRQTVGFLSEKYHTTNIKRLCTLLKKLSR